MLRWSKQNSAWRDLISRIATVIYPSLVYSCSFFVFDRTQWILHVYFLTLRVKSARVRHVTLTHKPNTYLMCESNICSWHRTQKFSARNYFLIVGPHKIQYLKEIIWNNRSKTWGPVWAWNQATEMRIVGWIPGKMERENDGIRMKNGIRSVWRK